MARPSDDRLFALGLAGLCGLAALHPVHETDPFWHLSLGRAVLREGARTVPDPTAHPAFSDPAVVPEWLWGVFTYQIHQMGGFPLLVVATGLMGATMGWVLWTLLRRWRDAPEAPAAGAAESARGIAGLSASSMAALLAAGPVASLALARMRLRPQAAFLIALPLMMWLGACWRRLPRSAGWDPASRRVAAATVLLQIFWAQLHGSFILGPTVWGLAAFSLPQWMGGRGLDLRRDLPLGLALCLGLATSAHGIGVVGYVLHHAGGYAADHIVDMSNPTWAALDPSRTPFGGALWVLLGLSLLGLLEGEREEGAPVVLLREVGLAMFGVALGATAVRFLAATGILAAPLALRGAHALVARSRAGARGRARSARVASGLLLLVGGGLLLQTLTRIHQKRGPIGLVAEAEGVHPTGAAAWLARHDPPGEEPWLALTDAGAGGPIGFWLPGRVKVSMDTRVPLHFDDTDYLVQRTVMGWPGAIDRGLARFGFNAAVVDRNAPVCAALLEGGWVPAMVESRWTLLVPSWYRVPEGPLEGLSACGAERLAPDFCAQQRSVSSVLPMIPDGYRRWIEAERALRCEEDPAAALAALPSGAAARTLSRSVALTRARALGALGRWAEAAETLQERIEEGDLEALSVVGPALVGEDPERAMGLLRAAAEALDDAASPRLRAELARVCAALGDAECARFHSFGAAAQGEPGAAPALRWVAQTHPSERARVDAAAWLGVLQGEPGDRP